MSVLITTSNSYLVNLQEPDRAAKARARALTVREDRQGKETKAQVDFHDSISVLTSVILAHDSVLIL